MAGPAPAEAGAETAQAVRVVAFGDLDSGLWGAAWVPPGGPGVGAVGVGSEAAAGPVSLEGYDSSTPWRWRGEDVELELEGLSAPVLRDSDDPRMGFDQLCRVSGPGRGLPCLGWRSVQAEPAKVSSVRQVAAWFEPGHGFAVLALRPTKAKGQDQDVLFASQFDHDRASRVVDPRLSTTYVASGDPGRAGVELWVEAAEDSEHLYPHRAVGEAIGPSVQWEVRGLLLETRPFRWQGSGHEGAGIYVLGRSR